MHVRLSKKMRIAIIINVVLALIALGVHLYHMNWSYQSNAQIVSYMKEHNVIKETAVRMLEKEGVDLFVPSGLSYIFGIIMSLLTIWLLFLYSRSNRFFPGFFAALCAVLTTYIGGFILFYIMFTEKGEVASDSRLTKKSEWQTKWRNFIHKKNIQY